MNHAKTGGSFALITGASSGIGYEMARLLAQAGYNLILISRDHERLAQIASELSDNNNIEIVGIAKNLFDPSAPQEIFDMVNEQGLVVDILVNDAGQGEWGEFLTIDLQRSLDIIQLNIVSLVALTKLFLPGMVRRGNGKILQLGSEAGKTPMPLLSVYAATKAFVVSFSEALANELKETGVTCTVLMPGASDTDFFHKAHAEHTVTYRDEDLDSPEEVARTGFEAMMKGEASVIAGTQTKIHVLRSKLMPDESNAESSRKLMEPSKKRSANVRTESSHPASRATRKRINKKTGNANGDYPKKESFLKN
jgi:short-subunit dehydrogenase